VGYQKVFTLDGLLSEDIIIDVTGTDEAISHPWTINVQCDKYGIIPPKGHIQLRKDFIKMTEEMGLYKHASLSQYSIERSTSLLDMHIITNLTRYMTPNPMPIAYIPGEGFIHKDREVYLLYRKAMCPNTKKLTKYIRGVIYYHPDETIYLSIDPGAGVSAIKNWILKRKEL
jgi:hypothetical protein